MRRKIDDVIVSKAILLKPDGSRKEVEAEDMAKIRYEKPEEFASYIFLCPGTNRAGEVCTCRLNLCSWKDSNKKRPYFAHRDSDKTVHIKGCNQESGVRDIRFVDKLDDNMNNLDLNGLLNKMTAGETIAPPAKPPQNPGGETGEEEGEEIKKPKKVVDYVEEIVAVRNATDLYEVCVAVNESNKDIRTEKGWSSKGILINHDSIDLYRRGDFQLRGPKLVVASMQNLNPELAGEISKSVPGNTYVLIDPYTLERPDDKFIYYVLEFDGSDNLFEKYMDKLYKAREKDRMVLIFGRIRQIEVEEDIIACTITISDGRFRQIVELKKSYEDERRLR